MVDRRTATAGAAMASFFLAAGFVTASTPPTISFTREQAQRGQFAYMQNCALCHNTDLSGRYGPALKGPGGNLTMKTLGYVFSYMTAHMPMGDAGGLSNQDYADIMAFLLQANGLRPDRQPLIPVEAMKSQVIIGTAR
jgi:cytochrome c